MRVAAAQMDIVWHDRSANYATARRCAEAAQKEGADLLILPEMFSTGFSMDTSITPEYLNGPTPTLMRSLAQELDMTVVGGFVLEQDRERPQNVALAVDREGRDHQDTAPGCGGEKHL